MAACGAESDATPDFDAGAGDGGAEPPPARVSLRDAEGRVLLLRGTNVEGAAKSAADHLPRQGVEDFRRLREELGLNAIRLLVFWQAIEPEQGVYDDAYLAAVRDVSSQAGEAGLLVLVDMHQDVYGEGFGFAGAPRWTCDESLYASFEPPAQWYLGYFEPEVMECFDRLYADPGLRAGFAAAWARLARELRDGAAVVAYEVLNEPSWGSGTSRDFDRRIAPALYGEVIDAIRAEDPRPHVAVEPASAANVGIPTDLVPPDRERLVYAPHYYPIAVERGDGYAGDVDALRSHLRVVLDDAAALGLPPVLTELGARPDVPGAEPYVRDLYDLLDEARLGAFQWEIRGGYDLVDDTGAPTAIGLAVARPYPARTAGALLSFHWDGEARVFTAEWEEDGTATADTIVITPSVAFPTGKTATLEDGGEAVDEGAQLRVPWIGGRRALRIEG